jgi:hypothetical protein
MIRKKKKKRKEWNGKEKPGRKIKKETYRIKKKIKKKSKKESYLPPTRTHGTSHT